MQSLHEMGARVRPQSLLEFPFPDLRSYVWIITDPSPDLVIVPVPFKFIRIVLTLRIEQGKGLGPVRLSQHLGGQHIIDLKAPALVESGAGCKAAHIVGIGPQETACGAPVLHAPVYGVLLRIAQQIRIAVTPVMLVLTIDVRGMEGQAHLFHPVLGGYAQLDALVQAVVDNRVG